MAGNGKHMVWHDYQTAFETVFHGIVELDEPIGMENGSREVTRLDMMESSYTSPEDEIIMKDSFSHLSKEAMEVINLVLNSPMEVIECLKTPKYDKISKRKVRKYLEKNGWETRKVKSCFEELREFCSEFY